MLVIEDMAELRRAAIAVALLAVASGLALLRRERVRRRGAVEAALRCYLSGPFAGLDDLPAMLVGCQLAAPRDGATGAASDDAPEGAAAGRVPLRS